VPRVGQTKWAAAEQSRNSVARAHLCILFSERTFPREQLASEPQQRQGKLGEDGQRRAGSGGGKLVALAVLLMMANGLGTLGQHDHVIEPQSIHEVPQDRRLLADRVNQGPGDPRPCDREWQGRDAAARAKVDGPPGGERIHQRQRRQRIEQMQPRHRLGLNHPGQVDPPVGLEQQGDVVLERVEEGLAGPEAFQRLARGTRRIGG